jgi:transketolase
MQKGFKNTTIDQAEIKRLGELARNARGDILTMTTLAASGHPGGSMSSIDMYTVLMQHARINPDKPHDPARDHIVVSHGHTSPGVYAALAGSGFFAIDDAITGFRHQSTIFEGHIERTIPGVEWSSGNLGQGLSAGCAFALSARMHATGAQTFVVMGDGEQQKGQITEARRFAAKYKLGNLTVLIDKNHLQISGDTKDVMPQNIKENFISDGWQVVEINGHDLQQICDALSAAVADESRPTAIIAETVMGKGVSFMENIAKYHGVTLTPEQLEAAMKELGLEMRLEHYRASRAALPALPPGPHAAHTPAPAPIDTGKPITYEAAKKTDNRSAFGNALCSIAEATAKLDKPAKIAVFDCDLAGSVKTNGFAKLSPDTFFQTGIEEHNAATMAGAMSIEGVLTFFADFGVFGVSETYNQHRLSDINATNLKLVTTHIGLDVGEDGKTHQCIDYIGLMNNLFGFKTLLPADPNQTDRATRYMAGTTGNFYLGMGRSKLPVILNEQGEPFFGNDYVFEYGKIDMLRAGQDAAIITCGSLAWRAVEAADRLKKEGLSVAVLHVACPKDIDRAAISTAASTGCIVTYEDHNVHTGLGSIIACVLAEERLSVSFSRLGVTEYGLSGPSDTVYIGAGLGVDDLIAAVKENLKNK